MSIETMVPNLADIGLDIEAAKQSMLEHTGNMTDINDRIMDKDVTPTKLESAEYTDLRTSVKQMYLADLTACETITESWINGLKSMILCTTLEEFDSEKANAGRFEHGLADVFPDAALSLKIKALGESKVVFIGYMDSSQAYMLLGNYIGAVKGAKLYLDNSEALKEVKATNIEGMRVHI